MAIQTFADGESAASVRTKINTNATTLDSQVTILEADVVAINTQLLGSWYVSTNLTNTANGTPTKLGGGSTTANLLEGFTHTSSNRLTYTGTETKTFKIAAVVSVTHSTNNTNITFYIAKNGTIITASKVLRKVGTGGDVGATPLLWIENLATNDYIEIFSDADSSGTTTISAGVMDIHKI